jgi:hypothetical protein
MLVKIIKVFADSSYCDYCDNTELAKLIPATEWESVDEEKYNELKSLIIETRTENNKYRYKQSNKPIYYLLSMPEEDQVSSIDDFVNSCKTMIEEREAKKKQKAKVQAKRAATMKDNKEKKDRAQFERLKKELGE